MRESLPRPQRRHQTWVLISSKRAVAIARSARMLRLRRIERDQIRGHDSWREAA